MENYEKKKTRRMLVLGITITVFILVMFLSFNNISDIFKVVQKADVKYILISIAMLALYFVLYPLSLCLLAKSKKTKTSFKDTFVIASTEHFFNGITPFATGGQPFEVYAFNKLGVKPAESTGLLIMNFLIHMIVTNIFALCSLFYYSDFVKSIENIQALVIVGFVINFLVLLFIISLATSKKVRHFLEKCIQWLCKIKFLKKYIEPKVPSINQYFEQVQSSFKELWGHKLIFFECLIIRFITMAVYYVMTFYILRALHVNVDYEKIFFVMCGTSFAITTCTWLPTPGSSGGIEFAFKSIFVSIAGVSNTVAYGGMLLWRLLSYYLIMLFSFFAYLIFERIYFKQENQKMKKIQEMMKNNAVINKIKDNDKKFNTKFHEINDELKEKDKIIVKKINLNKVNNEEKSKVNKENEKNKVKKENEKNKDKKQN